MDGARFEATLDCQALADPLRTALIAWVLTAWCANQFDDGDWALERSEQRLKLSFAKPEDLLLFNLSTEFSRFAGVWS